MIPFPITLLLAILCSFTVSLIVLHFAKAHYYGVGWREGFNKGKTVLGSYFLVRDNKMIDQRAVYNEADAFVAARKAVRDDLKKSVEVYGLLKTFKADIPIKME